MSNFVTNAGSGGSTFASDTISTVEYPLAKSAWGAAGAVNQTSLSAPLPVQEIGTASVATTGAITTSSTAVPVTLNGAGTVTVYISGTYAGVNISFQCSPDGGTTYFPVCGARTDTGIIESTSGVLTANTSRAWDISVAEATHFRVLSTAFTSGSGAISILVGGASVEPAPSTITQGPAATNSPALGNPVLVGGVFTTALPTITSGNVGQFQMTTKGETLVALSTGGVAATHKAASTAAAFTDTSVVVENRPGGAQLTASAALADALANPTLGQQAVLTSVFNGTTWDRTRGMSTALTTGDTGAKTATGNGATQTNVGNKGASIVVNMGAVTGTTPTCVIKVQGSADAGTTWYDIPGATTASLVATGVWGITVYPGVTTVAGTTTSISGTATCGQVLPRTWRVVWTIGGTTPSFTITNIQVIYLPN